MDPTDNLVFQLSLTTLNKLIDLFKDYIYLFESANPEIDDTKKSSMLNETCNLISDLIKMKIKNEDQAPKKKIKLFHLLNKSFDPINLKISQENKLKVIVSLIKNQDLLVSESSSNSRQAFVDYNKTIIEMLVDLPNQNIELDTSKEITQEDLELYEKKSKVIDHSSDSESEEDQENNSNSLNKRSNATMEKAVEAGQGILVKTNSMSLDNQNASEVNYEFEFEGIEEFLTSKNGVFYSETFECAGIPWFLEMCSSKNKKKSRNFYKFLTIGLVRDKAKSEKNWTATANFTIKILNDLNSDNDKVEVFENQIFRSGQPLRGFYENKFIRYTELANGFIFEDKIRISIHLSIDFKSMN